MIVTWKQVEELDPWDQQPDEPDLHYGRFATFYLRQDRLERTVKEAHKRYVASQPPGADLVGLEAFYDGSRAWKWVERARAFDKVVDQRIQAQLEHRRLTSALETADLGRELRTKASQAAKMLQPIRRELGMQDGREIVILASSLTPEQIVRMADIGVKIEQLAVGNPTERPQLSNDPANPVGITPETAAAVLRQKLAEIRARRDEADAAPTDAAIPGA